MDATDKERLVRLETQVAEHDRKLSNLEELTLATHDLANSVKSLNDDIGEIKNDCKETKEKVNDLEDRPYKLSGKLWVWLLGLIGSAVVGGLIGLISNTLF